MASGSCRYIGLGLGLRLGLGAYTSADTHDRTDMQDRVDTQDTSDMQGPSLVKLISLPYYKFMQHQEVQMVICLPF